MNVVFAGPFGLRPRGTMAVRALPLARALAARGHRVTVLLPPWQNPEDAGQVWEENGVRVENIPLPPRTPLVSHILLAGRLARRALALRPHIVHFFKPKAYSGLAHWLMAHLRSFNRPRWIVDTDDWEGPGGWNDVRDPQTGKPIYSSAQRHFFAWQERWSLTHADAVTVASRTLESLVWAMGVPPERVFYIPNGFSQDFSPPLRPADTPVILLYTRFFEFPPERALNILGQVREHYPDASLLVVGKGLFGEEERFLQEAQRRGLASAVEYAGWVDPQRLRDVFARAALAIYPFDDTLINRTKCPVKLLDLLGAGIPVIAEEVGEIRELIRHGETGWLVPPGDEEGFARAVITLLGDPERRARLGEAAAQRVRQIRSWDRLAEIAEGAYLQVLRGFHGAAPDLAFQASEDGTGAFRSVWRV
ncbi:MAG: glycosyltransferase family 4 protein [Anaerolineae bacterium]|nr:glycosyltransferase family 4 protein [Anaerolineae bacterium]MCX8066647.1 glycosyltransferase family 4 protein [Anaerolineae bacterium]MDW7992532.1 glycosyltransferase family 4 protein [Anaerolineae bacterium]